MSETGAAVEVEFESPKEGRKKTRRVLAVVGALFLVLFLVAAGAFAWLSNKLGALHTLGNPFADVSNIEGASERPQHQDEDSAKPTTFLVLGSDSRISAGDPKAWKAGAQRTDAFMIAQIAGDGKSLNIMSIPRDSWVPIPGYDNAKINAAFSYGGPALTIATVEQLTKIPIDHVAVVDFTSFSKITDVVGGVEMTSKEGTKKYNGEEALAFVRERKHLPGGDFDRVRRQQLWLSSVMKQTLASGAFSSPSKALDLYTQISPYVAIDDKFGTTDAVSFALSLRGMDSSKINFVTAPVTGVGRSADGQSIVNLDKPKFDEISKAFASDKAAEYIESHKADLKTLDSAPVN
ncbi:LCP family protein required for cell wall assembly [Arcanobacterium wilhelmae]|uniref:LCP family protein required for cell wall assembly n=1 Tax=Arcanobacterium wilhelmae TaxID=1803177 RepID=A0ABT9NBX5_9ACTO|nr:LCP family protein [Arcanobacterium wilhelmae]MDP9801222.1 LCP family protein required for cell wall assembly [Arcanobacterium wilhelmae]WFN90571.1 LCP family protein [Arcanobacterium wilhelmae]